MALSTVLLMNRCDWAFLTRTCSTRLPAVQTRRISALPASRQVSPIEPGDAAEPQIICSLGLVKPGGNA